MLEERGFIAALTASDRNLNTDYTHFFIDKSVIKGREGIYTCGWYADSAFSICVLVSLSNVQKEEDTCVYCSLLFFTLTNVVKTPNRCYKQFFPNLFFPSPLRKINI